MEWLISFLIAVAGTGAATHRLLQLGANPLTAVEPDQHLSGFLRTHIQTRH